jgi:hypothetical protein
VALWSWRPASWRTYDDPGIFTHGLTQPFDLVAPGGPDNVWIVEVGNAAQHESFDAFRRATGRARVDVRVRPVTADGLPGGFDVQYDSPTRGAMAFGTDTPLTVDGSNVAQRFERRYDNPWTQVGWNETTIEISDPDGGIVLDLDRGSRTPT